MNDTTALRDPQSTYDAELDRAMALARCWRAFAGLIVPGDDLHAVGRSELAALIGLLSDAAFAPPDPGNAVDRLAELGDGLCALNQLLAEGDPNRVDRNKLATLASLIVHAQETAPAPPAASAASCECAPSDQKNNVPLHFRVAPDLRRRFRMFAATHDLRLNELFRIMFEEYQQRHGR